jgi:hypothetical protein
MCAGGFLYCIAAAFYVFAYTADCIASGQDCDAQNGKDRKNCLF